MDAILTVDRSSFGGNAAFGASSFSGVEGDGSGGAIDFAGNTLTVTDSSFLGNWALADPNGLGIGGLYIAGGTTCINKKTLNSFSDNIASTSNPDIFGPYILC